MNEIILFVTKNQSQHPEESRGFYFMNSSDVIPDFIFFENIFFEFQGQSASVAVAIQTFLYYFCGEERVHVEQWDV